MRLLKTASIATFLAFTTACGDPLGLTASQRVETDALTLYAMTGTPSNYPSALHTPELAAVRADGVLNYDIAFDIDAQGRVLLYPMELTASVLGETHPVGLQLAGVPWDSLTAAPRGGYVTDSVLVAEPGDVIAIEATVPRYCGYPYPMTMYSKLAIDEVDLVRRSIAVRLTVNPNCGFRSLLPGIPSF
jgi:hypothetical protein